MNGEFKKWSEDALEIMRLSDKSNKEEHKQILDTIDSLRENINIGIRKSLRKMAMSSLAFVSIAVAIVAWEIYENTPYFK